MITVGDDIFVGDEVRERWNNGEKTRAVTDVIWNVGSLFIPGSQRGQGGRQGREARQDRQGGLRGRGRGGRCERRRPPGPAGRGRGRPRRRTQGGEGGRRGRGQRRGRGAPHRLRHRRRTAQGPVRRRRVRRCAGRGHRRARGRFPGRIVLAEGGCDEAAKKAADEARAAERQAHLDQKRLEEPERARRAEADKKKYPEPKRNDTSDPRNYNPPSWARRDLKDRTLGDADAGDGYWASRDRNPAPNWKNESWLRYQEQVTGTNRGQEYVVPHPREGKPAVEYDGWDSSRQTFLEAKNGYGSYLVPVGPGS